MNTIILPDTEEQRQARFKESEKWHLIYDLATDEFRRKADELHRRRMMSGKACAQCIEMTYRRLNP